MKQIKSIKGLIKYLREKHHININGSIDKQHLKSVDTFMGIKDIDI